MINLKHRKYGRISIKKISSVLDQTLGTQEGNFETESFSIMKACYVDENYYDYFKGVDKYSSFDPKSSNLNFHDPQSYHNIHKPYKPGQLSTLFNTPR